MMHIGFLTPEYPHPKVAHAAGLGTSVKNLAEALSKKGVEVTVFVYAQSRSEIFNENGITIYLIPDQNFLIGKWFFYRKFVQQYIQKIINSEKIDLLEVPDWTGVTAFMKFSVPIVVRFHGSDTYFCHIENRKQKLKNRLFETIAVRRAQGYIAPTRYAGEVSSRLFGIKHEKIQTIHHGLNLNQFKNDAPEIVEKNVILYIGTIIRKKGVFELPNIFNNIRIDFPEARLILIGSDASDVYSGKNSTWELLQSMFSKDDLSNVTYLGKLPYEEIKNYIKKANVCVFPTYAETLGMVTIESMAMQKPVVNSSIGWAQELIKDGESGFLVYPNHHDLFANKIKSILADDKLSIEIGKSARLRVEKKFDIEKIVEQNKAYYRSLIINKH